MNKNLIEKIICFVVSTLFCTAFVYIPLPGFMINSVGFNIKMLATISIILIWGKSYFNSMHWGEFIFYYGLHIFASIGLIIIIWISVLIVESHKEYVSDNYGIIVGAISFVYYHIGAFCGLIILIISKLIYKVFLKPLKKS